MTIVINIGLIKDVLFSFNADLIGTVYWKFMKHKATDFDGVALLKVDGKLVTDPKLKAEALNSQFQSVVTRETYFHPTPTSPQLPSMDKINVTEAAVLKLLKNMNPGKVSGPDNTSPRVLKFAYPLTCIFRKSLSSGQVPKDWRCANVAPVLKVRSTCVLTTILSA